LNHYKRAPQDCDEMSADLNTHGLNVRAPCLPKARECYFTLTRFPLQNAPQMLLDLLVLRVRPVTNPLLESLVHL